MQRNYDYILKFVIVGPSSVGKSAILKRFSDDEFEETYISTIGIDFRFKSMHINEQYVKLQIWDTAGQQRFRGITQSYYKGAHAIILMYDINNPKTFEELKNFWIKETEAYSNSENIFCFANKCDSYHTSIPWEQAQFLKTKNIEPFQVSAKTGRNVNDAILYIAERIMEITPKIQQKKMEMTLKEHHAKKDKKCCG